MRQSTSHKHNVLGYGLVAPLRRVASSDFAAAEGEALVRSCIRQVLGTRPGELPWRPEFGIDLEAYRHANATPVLRQDIAQAIRGAIGMWEPRIQILDCQTGQDGNTVLVRVLWTMLSSATAGSNVLIGPVTQEVTL